MRGDGFCRADMLFRHSRRQCGTLERFDGDGYPSVTGNARILIRTRALQMKIC